MRLILLIISLLLIQVGVKAENDFGSITSCSEFEEWSRFFDQYEEEYLDRQRGGTKAYDHIRNNLFSDKYFKPIFGKSFDEFSTSKRNVTQVQLQKCIGKKNSLHRLKFYTLNAFSAREYGEISEAVKKIREKRKQYNEMLARLSDNKQLLTPNELSRIRSTNFRDLLETENEHLEKLVDDYQLRLDRNLFITEANRLSKSPADISILKQIVDLEKKNSGYILVDNMPQNVKEANQKMVNHKNSIIASLMINTIDQLDSEMDRVKFQTTTRDFIQQYGKFMSEDQVKKTYEKLLDQGAKIMKTNEPEFIAKVNTAESQEDLDKIKAIYLNFLSEETQRPYIAKLEQRHNFLVEKHKLEAIQLENLRKEKLNTNGVSVKSTAYWKKNYPNAGEMIKAVTDGEFKKIKKDIMLFYFFKQYVLFIGKRCPSVLPENKIRIAIYKSHESTSIDQTYLTGLSQMPIYTTYKTENSTSIDSIYIDPRLHNKDIISEDQVQTEILTMAMKGMTSGDDEIFKILQIMREVNSFVKKEDCDNGIMGQIGENFYRYIEQKPSIQESILLQP